MDNKDPQTKETPLNNKPKQQKTGHSFKKVPTYTKSIDQLRKLRENGLDKKDSLINKLPKTIRYLKPSPMQSFGAIMLVSAFFTWKALKGKNFLC